MNRFIVFSLLVLVCAELKAELTAEQPENLLNNRWAVNLMFGASSEDKGDILDELNGSDLQIAETSNSSLTPFSGGVNIRYFYGNNWATNFDIIRIADYSDGSGCWFNCEFDGVSASLDNMRHYSLTQSYYLQAWSGGYIDFNGGITLTTYEVTREIYTDEAGSWETLYSQKDQKVGATVGIQLTQLLGDSFALGAGFKQYSSFGSTFGYVQLGYVF